MVEGTLFLIQKGQTSGCITDWMQWNSGRSMQWMQWNSGIWWWGQCLWYKKVKLVDALDAVHSTHTTIYHYSTTSTVSTAYCIHCVHCVTASTASTGLTFLHQRQCPHHHITLFHWVHCILRPLV